MSSGLLFAQFGRGAAERLTCRLSGRKFQSVSKSAVELSEFERRQSGYKVSQFVFEHQAEEIAADRAGARQTVVGSQYDLRRESEDFAVNRSADYRRHIFMFGDEGT